jgi:hypothetical protein
VPFSYRVRHLPHHQPLTLLAQVGARSCAAWQVVGTVVVTPAGLEPTFFGPRRGLSTCLASLLRRRSRRHRRGLSIRRPHGRRCGGDRRSPGFQPRGAGEPLPCGPGVGVDSEGASRAARGGGPMADLLPRTLAPLVGSVRRLNLGQDSFDHQVLVRSPGAGSSERANQEVSMRTVMQVFVRRSSPTAKRCLNV